MNILQNRTYELMEITKSLSKKKMAKKGGLQLIQTIASSEKQHAKQ